MQEGNREKADEYHALWFNAIQPRLQAHPEDVALLHQTAGYCIGIGKYVDEAIEMQLRAIELETEANWREERYYLSRLYGLKGDTETALGWAKSFIQHLPDLDSDDITYVGKDLASLSLHINRFPLYVWDYLGWSVREGKIPPQRLLRWCEEVLNLRSLNMPKGNAIDVSLNAGLNRFLVATISGDQTGHYFRLTDREGNPIPGLEFVSAKCVL